MYKVGPAKYEQMLDLYYDKKIPLFVYGPPGIGKSDIPRQVFLNKAKKLNKIYMEWSDMTRENKIDAINSPEKYFIYCDQRIVQMDTTDLRGIPRLDGEWLDVCPLAWIVYFTQKNAAGVIMFDEINLAPPTVAGQAYEIIQERSIADRRLSSDVLVIAAGNRGQDKAFTFDMSLPLRDRFAEIELVVDYKRWTKWAVETGINSYLIAFINWKPSYLYTLEDVAGSDKGASPRGIERINTLIGDEDILEENDDNISVYDIISSSCGEAWANEFNAYIKHVKTLEWDNIMSNPDVVTSFKIDMLWAIAGGLPQYWTNHADPVGEFDIICNVIENMRDDFAIVTLRMMKDADKDLWGECVKNSKNFKTIAKKYIKFLFDVQV
jgi:hypothetical protein